MTNFTVFTRPQSPQLSLLRADARVLCVRPLENRKVLDASMHLVACMQRLLKITLLLRFCVTSLSRWQHATCMFNIHNCVTRVQYKIVIDRLIFYVIYYELLIIPKTIHVLVETSTSICIYLQPRILLSNYQAEISLRESLSVYQHWHLYQFYQYWHLSDVCKTRQCRASL